MTTYSTYAEAKAAATVAAETVLVDGRTAQIMDVPAYREVGRSSWDAHQELVVGSRWVRGMAGTPAQVFAKLNKRIVEDREDEAMLPELVRLVENYRGDVELVQLEAPYVGQVVYVYAMGQSRRGKVIKVSKSGKATIAYTTASSGGRVFRKAAAALVPAV